MPRANRHFLGSEGYIWHITHRCHKGDFLLELEADKLNWLSWIRQAKKVYGLRVLNYVVTSNHIHLLVIESGHEADIARSIQLAAGQTAQRYNWRNARRGAFWQDRYQATAVDRGCHLANCMVYIDLNMVRAGVIKHPAEWPFGGYHEIQAGSSGNRIIELSDLQEVFGFRSPDEATLSLQNWANEALQSRRLSREECWTKSIAVGSREFVDRIKRELRERGIGKRVVEGTSLCTLREQEAKYERLSGRGESNDWP